MVNICYVRPPTLVFQCASCRSILSDSDLFVCSIEILNVLVVTGGSGIHVDPINQPCSLVSQTERDSSYMAVTCECCGSAVGRMYTQTPPELTPIAQKFTLEIASITSYKLGHSEVHSTGEPQAALLTPAPSAANQAGGQTNNMSQNIPDMQQPYAESSLQDRIQQLEADMTKVQNMLLLHSERLDSMSGETG
ncbi:hypothetical protein ABBQ32_012226 [Trebouxia sp. C0010 RCD-2024]